MAWLDGTTVGRTLEVLEQKLRAIVNAGTAAALAITQTGNTSASTSAGGAFNLDNTLNTGAGMVLYSNQAAPAGRLFVVRVDSSTFNQAAARVQSAGSGAALEISATGTGAGISAAAPGTTGTTHALTAQLLGTGGTLASAANFVSANLTASCVQITGVETGRGSLKIAHVGDVAVANDANAAALSLDLRTSSVAGGVQTAAQGIFIDATTGGTSGSLLVLRNNTNHILELYTDTALTRPILQLGSGGLVYTMLPTGSPEGVLAHATGSVCQRGDGGPGSSLYVKGIGGGNTGWFPVGPDPGWFNVKAYGAKGDGSTADYTAIAAAITACSAAGGGVVYFPTGTYNVATSIAVPSNVRLVGAGKNATILSKTASIDLLSFAGSSNASRCQRGGAMDMKLQGNGFSGSLIYCKWADHLNFDRVWCFNNADMALYTENLWDTYLDHVEFDTCSAANGLGPAVQITSNSDDSSNIIVFNGCRWENFIDGAVVISSRKMVSAYTTVTGTNPPYGIYFTNCKWETPQLRGIMFDASADVSDVHIDGLYVAARGLYTGISTGRTLFNLVGAYDFSIERVKILINGVTNPTVGDVFRVFTNGRLHIIRDVQLDCQQLPSGAILDIAGGSPDLVYENVEPRSGQTPTLLAGTWPPQVASATAMTLPNGPPLVVITGTTTITSITAQIPGRRVTLKFAAAATLTDGASNLRLASTLTGAADTTITLVCDGTNWIEIGRSVN